MPMLYFGHAAIHMHKSVMYLILLAKRLGKIRLIVTMFCMGEISAQNISRLITTVLLITNLQRVFVKLGLA